MEYIPTLLFSFCLVVTMKGDPMESVTFVHNQVSSINQSLAIQTSHACSTVGCGIICTASLFCLSFVIHEGCQCVLMSTTSERKGNQVFVVDGILSVYDLDSASIKQKVQSAYGCTHFYQLTSCYLLLEQSHTWTEARKQCEMRGMSLVVIDTFEKWNVAMDLIKNEAESFWVSARIIDGNVQWVHKDGQQSLSTFRKFTMGQILTPLHCMHVDPNGQVMLLANCAEVRKSICERNILA